MELNDEIRIAAPRNKVFEALNDVDVLKQSIPGCIDLEKQSETEMTATVSVKVGPVKAKFNGAVTLSDLNPPESYHISGEGKGGAAGFASGGAKITLDEDGQDTVLRYEVSAKVGGKLAQIGNRLIDSTAKKLAGEFFETFVSLVDTQGPDEVKDEPEEKPTEPETAETPVSRWMVTGALSLVLTAVVIWLLAG
jgi:carbon monoxide dehydrogenase subunit G